MSDSPTKRAAELGCLLARHYPDAPMHMIGSVVDAMQHATRQAVRWEVKRCNDPMTEAQDERGHARLRRLQEGLNGLLAYRRLFAEDGGDRSMSEALQARVQLGGDPRGPCGRLVIPGTKGDGWGDGFAIY